MPVLAKSPEATCPVWISACMMKKSPTTDRTSGSMLSNNGDLL